MVNSLIKYHELKFMSVDVLKYSKQHNNMIWTPKVARRHLCIVLVDLYEISHLDGCDDNICRWIEQTPCAQSKQLSSWPQVQQAAIIPQVSQILTSRVTCAAWIEEAISWFKYHIIFQTTKPAPYLSASTQEAFEEHKKLLRKWMAWNFDQDRHRANVLPKLMHGHCVVDQWYKARYETMRCISVDCLRLTSASSYWTTIFRWLNTIVFPQQ